MDPRLQETPEEGAKRELLEETGLASEKVIYLGSHHPNPALQTNQTHTFIALEAKKVQEPQLDPFEDLSLYPCDLEELKEHIAKGTIRHSIMMASLSLCLPYLEQHLGKEFK